MLSPDLVCCHPIYLFNWYAVTQLKIVTRFQKSKIAVKVWLKGINREDYANFPVYCDMKWFEKKKKEGKS